MLHPGPGRADVDAEQHPGAALVGTLRAERLSPRESLAPPVPLGG